MHTNVASSLDVIQIKHRVTSCLVQLSAGNTMLLCCDRVATQWGVGVARACEFSLLAGAACQAAGLSAKA